MSQYGDSSSLNTEDSTKLRDQLDKIKALETQLTKLKHQFVEAAAVANEELAMEDEATFLLITNIEQVIALPIAYVEEVVQMVGLHTLAENVRGVVGLLDFHGEMMAVLDLSELVGTGKTMISAERSMVICRSELLNFALVVDEVTDVVTASRKDVQVATEVLPGALRALGVLRLPGRAAVIVDILSILLEVQLDRLQQDVSSLVARISSIPPPEETT